MEEAVKSKKKKKKRDQNRAREGNGSPFLSDFSHPHVFFLLSLLSHVNNAFIELRMKCKRTDPPYSLWAKESSAQRSALIRWDKKNKKVSAKVHYQICFLFFFLCVKCAMTRGSDRSVCGGTRMHRLGLRLLLDDVCPKRTHLSKQLLLSDCFFFLYFLNHSLEWHALPRTHLAPPFSPPQLCASNHHRLLLKKIDRRSTGYVFFSH